jgi:hypothetical protein
MLGKADSVLLTITHFNRPVGLVPLARGPLARQELALALTLTLTNPNPDVLASGALVHGAPVHGAPVPGAPVVLYCPVALLVDSNEVVADDEGRLCTGAFASSEFTSTQQRWFTIQREAFAALWALQKYKQWIFGMRMVLISDHNPLTLFLDFTPMSSKLMRWALAMQEFDRIPLSQLLGH